MVLVVCRNEHVLPLCLQDRNLPFNYFILLSNSFCYFALLKMDLIAENSLCEVSAALVGFLGVCRILEQRNVVG